jgi:hypothetical protein
MDLRTSTVSAQTHMTDDLLLLVSNDDRDFASPSRRWCIELAIQDCLVANRNKTFGTFTVNRTNPCAVPCRQKNYLALHILPKWGDHSLSAIKSVEVESWLRNLTTANGKPASPATQTKIRNLMSAIFSHASRYEWAARNPISPVGSSAKRLRRPDILTAETIGCSVPRSPSRICSRSTKPSS